MEKLLKKDASICIFLNVVSTYLDHNKNIGRENLPNIARIVNKQCGTCLTNFDVFPIVGMEIAIVKS